VPRKIKTPKQYKPMGFGDRDDRGSVKAHLRAKADSRETRPTTERGKSLNLRKLPSVVCCPGWCGSSVQNLGDTEVIIQWPSKIEEFIACPVGLALWQGYARRNPDGLKVPPVDGHNVEDQELLPYNYLTRIRSSSTEQVAPSCKLCNRYNRR